MVLIKYYKLESDFGETSSDLEKDLQKYFLTMSNPQDQEYGTSDIIIASGEFDVIYRSDWMIESPKMRIFSRDIPAKIGMELLLRANTDDISLLQRYIATSDFDVVEARSVQSCTFLFSTQVSIHSFVKNYMEVIENLTQNYQNQGNILRTKFKTIETRDYHKNRGAVCCGMLDGDIEAVLEIRRLLLNAKNTLKTQIYESTIEFKRSGFPQDL